MSTVDDLTASLAPDGVRHVELRELASYSWTRVDASRLDNTSFVGVDNLVSEKGGRVDANYLPNTTRLTAYESGDILLGNIRPYLQKVWRATASGGCSGDVIAIRIEEAAKLALDSEFLYYLLSSDDFFAYNMQYAKGAKMPRGNKDAIIRYRIPVPPLQVQREIVRILDQFTQLEVELEAELEARQRQYRYYRRLVVEASQFGIKVPISSLEDAGVLTLGRGKVISRRDIENSPGDYPVYSSSGRGTGEFGCYAFYMFDDERITWSVDGGGRFFYRHPHRFSVTNVSGWMTVDPTVLRTKYLYHVLTVQWEKQSFDYVKKAHPSVIRNVYDIAIPPLDDQDLVIRQLGDFEDLCDNLSAGIPAELRARRQQYEYYRDKLLTFKELPA